MTDQPEETELRATAEAPRLAAIDGDKLEAAADRRTEDAVVRHGQIITGAQQRLIREETRHAELHEAKGASRDLIARTEESIAKLQAGLAQEQANLRDLEIEDKAVLKTIASLRDDGIELP